MNIKSDYNVFEHELSPEKVKRYGYNILDQGLKKGDIVFAYRDIDSEWLGWVDNNGNDIKNEIIIAKFSIGEVRLVLQDGDRGLFDQQLEVYWNDLAVEYDSMVAFQSLCFAVDVRKLNWMWRLRIWFEKFKKNPSEFLYNILSYRWS